MEPLSIHLPIRFQAGFGEVVEGSTNDSLLDGGSDVTTRVYSAISHSDGSRFKALCCWFNEDCGPGGCNCNPQPQR